MHMIEVYGVENKETSMEWGN